MKKRKKGGGIKVLLIVLVIALLAVAAVIVWRQYEYGVSEKFYDGLRGALRLGGVKL